MDTNFDYRVDHKTYLSRRKLSDCWNHSWSGYAHDILFWSSTVFSCQIQFRSNEIPRSPFDFDMGFNCANLKKKYAYSQQIGSISIKQRYSSYFFNLGSLREKPSIQKCSSWKIILQKKKRKWVKKASIIKRKSFTHLGVHADLSSLWNPAVQGHQERAASRPNLWPPVQVLLHLWGGH